jgi:hypothetical protein
VAGPATAALAGPDILRRLIAPEEDESRGGAALEGGLYAAAPFAGRAIGAGARGVRRGLGAADEFFTGSRAAAQQATRSGSNYAAARAAGREPAMRMGPRSAETLSTQQTAVDPNQVLRVAREVSEETGVPIEIVLKGYTRSGGVEPGRMDALTRLLRSGERAPAPRAASSATFQRMQREGAFAGERTTGPFAEGPGGLSDLAAGRIKPHPLPASQRYPSEVDDLVRGLDEPNLPAFTSEGAQGLPADLVPPSALRRLLGR